MSFHGAQVVYIVLVVVVSVDDDDDDVLLRCVPMVMGIIDGYGFSFNYVGEHH